MNAYRQRGSISLVLRSIPHAVKSIEALGLPDVVHRLAEEERGIVLVTGSTGSGKSTTLAAIVDHINRTMRKHVVTIEDPIEYLHTRPQGVDRPARGRQRHRVVPDGAAACAAPGPRRDPDRGDA